MAAPNRKPKVVGAAGSTTTLSTAAGQMLRSLGLEAIDPEHVFELQSKEGAGAFGRVFRACYKHDPTRLAALKVIPVALEAGQRGEDIESVRKEIQFLRECDHPNVVAFYGAYYKDGALWVAMEYCGGGSVGDVSRARRLRESEIAVIMRGALRGLAYLHSKKKIHRDIKGGNILLTATGQVKIADFGVSAQLRDTMSRRGTFVGTPYWMSPEMIQDSDYDTKADIWSLGITAIELADQKPPLFDEHPMRVLIQIPRNPAPELARASAWSPDFARFLRFCLQKDPLARPTALACLDHTFIRSVDHIECVFAADVPVVARHDSSSSSAAVVMANSTATLLSASPSEVESALSSAAAATAAAESAPRLDAPLTIATHDTAAAAAAVSTSSALCANASVAADADVDDIAEDIAHLDDDANSSNSDDDDDRDAFTAGASSSENDSSASDDEASAAPSETFSFRQPTAVGVAALSTLADASASVSVVTGDELLELSVCDSLELPRDATLHTQHTANASPMTVASRLLDIPTVSASSSSLAPATELQLLLPAASTSPRTAHAKQRRNERTAESLATTANYAASRSCDSTSNQSARVQPLVPHAAPSTHELQEPHTSPPMSSSSSPQLVQLDTQVDSITATPPRVASVANVSPLSSSAWQNPLADIAPSTRASVTANGLLRSLHTSLSSSVTARTFAKLLHEHERSRGAVASPSDSVSSSRYVTPNAHVASIGRSSCDFTATAAKQRSFEPSLSLAAHPQHRDTSSSLRASTSQIIGSAFRIADRQQQMKTQRRGDDSVATTTSRSVVQSARRDLDTSPASLSADYNNDNDDTSASASDTQPLDKRIREIVGRFWRDLAVHDGIASLDALRTTPHVRAQSFARYQRDVLTLVAQCAKRRDDQQWAAEALACITDGADTKSRAVPQSLRSIQRWLIAALSIDAFMRLLECEWRTRDKLQQLCERFPMLSAGGRSSAVDVDCGDDALVSDRVLELVDAVNAVAARLYERSASSSSQDDARASAHTRLLQDGASAFAVWIGDTSTKSSSPNSSDTTVAIDAVAACGECEPAVANLLVALSESAALVHLPLVASRNELRALVQRVVQTHCRAIDSR